MEKRVLAFDFGASTGRALAGGIEDGRLVVEEISRFENEPVFEDGVLRWNFDALLSRVLDALSRAGDIDAIGIDTWGVDYGVIGADGALAAYPAHYRDRRTEGIPETVYRKIPEKKLYEVSGIQPMRINTLFQLYKEFVEDKTPAFGKKILLMPDLFAYFLTGEARAELTIASTSGLLDKDDEEWNFPLVKKLKIPERLFCPIIRPGESYGLLKEGLAAQLGIKRVPVIAVCTHDTASALALAGDGAYISSGTWSLMGAFSKKPILSDMRFTNERGADGVTYLTNIMGMWISQQIKAAEAKNGREYTWKQLDALMLEAEQPDAVIDPNAPDFELPDDMGRAIKNFCLRTGQRPPEGLGQTLLCVNNSLACRYKKTLGELEKRFGRTFNNINIVGGGSGNEYLCRVTAALTGASVTAGPAEATAIGNICAQLAAIGCACDPRGLIEAAGLIKKYAPEKSPAPEGVYAAYLSIEGK